MILDKVILDDIGADMLLGHGDMLFKPPDNSRLIRAQGALTTAGDLCTIVEFIKRQVQPSAAGAEQETILAALSTGGRPSFDQTMADGEGWSDGDEKLAKLAIQIIRKTRRASVEMLQRRLRIGFIRAAHVMEVLEERGIVGPAFGSDRRDILIDLDDDGVTPQAAPAKRKARPRRRDVAPTEESLSVFISSKSADGALARQVFEYLRANGTSAFMSDVSLPMLGNSDYRREIDRALERAHHMVVVSSSRENVEAPWVEAEWGFFINEKRAGRKTGNLVTVLAEPLLSSNLPPSLRYYESVPMDDHGLQKLLAYVRPQEEQAS